MLELNFAVDSVRSKLLNRGEQFCKYVFIYVKRKKKLKLKSKLLLQILFNIPMI